MTTGYLLHAAYLHAGVVCLCASTGFAGDPPPWVDFTDETAARLAIPANDPDLTVDDPEEKDYAWGDVDQDGDTDLIIMRKQPFSTPGGRPNVLLMNEGIADGHAVDGVLVDRTAIYAVASDIPGDMGFLTPTNDRDAILVDVNGNGWLDIVTAVTLTDNSLKHLSHPRIYMNLGEKAGIWQGFEYQDARIPLLHRDENAGPRFNSVTAGDLDNDGDLDLYFGDSDSGGTQIFDFNSRVLINTFDGHFIDQTFEVLPLPAMIDTAFSASNVIADMNGDGANDIVRQTSLNAPLHVAVFYNHPVNPGIMESMKIIYTLSPYHIGVGDLNNDGRLDIVVQDDNTDRYLLNQGNDGGGGALFQVEQCTLENGSSESEFGGNVVIADLDGDGFDDVVIADVDVDISNCSSGRTHMYHNMGGAPGSDVVLQEQGQPIPFDMLEGVHDAAIFDIDGDNRLDIVLGRCNSTEVWIQEPVEVIDFDYPDGLPLAITPNVPATITVQLNVLGDLEIEPGSEMIHVAVGDGPVESMVLVPLGGNLYSAELPAADCLEEVMYSFTALLTNGEVFTDPPDGTHRATGGYVVTQLDEPFEDVRGKWSVVDDPLLTSGSWELADPNGTMSGNDQAAPEDDATPGTGTMCFVTENGVPDGPAGAADVDGGPTHLISPALDLAGTPAVIGYARWTFSSSEASDALTTSVSNDDGVTWVEVASVTATTGAWIEHEFNVGDFVKPTSAVRVRFSIADIPNNSVVEAGIDDFIVQTIVCMPCPGNLDQDDVVGVTDLLILLGSWGPCTDCPADLNADGTVNTKDLLQMLSVWGPCTLF